MMQGPPGMGPVMVINQKTQRQTGRTAQLNNIQAAKGVANIIRTTLGPRSMLKMLLDPMGSVVLTNDGHCILREVDVSHPAAKSMIELSRAVDEEVGDGTTSVIIMAAEVLQQAEPFLRLEPTAAVHPTVIVSAYTKALAAALDIMDQLATTVNVIEDVDFMKKLVTSSLGTKFSSRWNNKMVDMALQAVLTVAQPAGGSSDPTSHDAENVSSKTETSTSTIKVQKEMDVDIKRYAKVEKIPGGEIDDSIVLKGVMFQKDTVHSSMRRYIENPRILLLDSPLEYKKGESQTNMEVSGENDWNALLLQEEEYVKNMCMEIISHKPDIVITEKGVSDLAQHYLAKANITAFRRLRKTDNNRIARAVGATIVSRTDEIQESDIGTGCGVFKMENLGNNEWYVYLTDCTDPKACTIILRGGSKDVLNEIERNLQDAMQVVRNIVYNPKIVPGGGAIEMSLSVALRRYGLANITGIQQAPFLAVADSFECIPRTLAQNCGVSVIRTITQLRAKHAAAYDTNETTSTNTTVVTDPVVVAAAGTSTSKVQAATCTWGIDGITGDIVDMVDYGIWEPYSVKAQTIKTAIESACMILRIDDIVSGSKKR